MKELFAKLLESVSPRARRRGSPLVLRLRPTVEILDARLTPAAVDYFLVSGITHPAPALPPQSGHGQVLATRPWSDGWDPDMVALTGGHGSGKVSVQDFTRGSGGGSGKVNVQDLHRTGSIGGGVLVVVEGGTGTGQTVRALVTPNGAACPPGQAKQLGPLPVIDPSGATDFAKPDQKWIDPF